MGFKMNTLGLIVLIAGLIALVAVFLAWFSAYGHSVSGWDFFGYRDIPGVSWKVYIPLFVLILAVVVVLFSLLSLFGTEIFGEMSKIVYIILGALILVLAIIFAHEGELKYAGIGLILEFVAALALIIVPLLAIFKVIPEK